MSYEDAVQAARSNVPSIPDFAGLADGAKVRREARIGNDANRRLRARRWLYVAVFGFLFIPGDVALRAWAMGYGAAVQGVAVAVMLPILMLGWAGRLVMRPTFGAQLLVRAIAASNLVVALLLALSVGGIFGAVSQVVIAVACYRVLKVLGDRGLDASDEGSPFTPIAFRGFLIFALIMAFADAQTLMFSALTQGSYLLTDERTGMILSTMAPTLLAAVVMGVNVWGLFRLRTWAMLLNIIANLVIARAALTGGLSVNGWVAASLALTAAIQLMLPVPILAAWMGDRGAGGRGWRWGAAALRLSLPLALAATTLAAVTHLGLARMWGWLDGIVASRAAVRGAPPFSKFTLGEFRKMTRGGDRVFGSGDKTLKYGPGMAEAAFLSDLDMSGCNLSGSTAPRMFAKAGDFRLASFADSDLREAMFVGTNLAGADFRGANLAGAALAECTLRDIKWNGATCPDGSVATAEVGCEDHLAHGYSVENHELERWMSSAWKACRYVHPDWATCRGLHPGDSAELVAVGSEDLELRWGAGSSAGSLALHRTGPLTWAAREGTSSMVGVPLPDGSVLVYARNPWAYGFWMDVGSRNDAVRTMVRDMSFGYLLHRAWRVFVD